MPREIKTQWEFGELFPSAATRTVLSVSELTVQIKRLLEKQVGAVWVSGEISNLRVQPSGHAYFTLKDVGAQLACVLFRGEATGARDALAEGRKVNLRGDVTVYETRGQYQLRVTEVELAGIGALQLAFERLKQKLAAEGLFALERKRPLPRFPRRLGLVTSLNAAALRDVLHVLERRFAGLEIILAPCRVQGDGAAAEIATAIRALNEFNSALRTPHSALDLILVTRGGGSLEDLWAFNEEAVARAIFESAVPVVSAVGHEIDFTIADFVADLRAATPSAAAELITADYVASREFIEGAATLLRRCVTQRLESERSALDSLCGRLRRAHPRRRLQERAQRVDELLAALTRAARESIRERHASWRLTHQRLRHLRPSRLLAQGRERLDTLARRLIESGRHLQRDRAAQVNLLTTRLKLLGPEQVLARGYSVTLDAATGRVVRDAATVATGQKLLTRLAVGEITSAVEAPEAQRPKRTAQRKLQ